MAESTSIGSIGTIPLTDFHGRVAGLWVVSATSARRKSGGILAIDFTE